MTLGEKRIQIYNHFEYSEDDVKEFIKLLKKEVNRMRLTIHSEILIKKIDKLAGEELIWKPKNT